VSRPQGQDDHPPARREVLPKGLAGPGAWARYAACRDAPGDVDFYIEGAKSLAASHEIDRAKAFCAGCQVRLACLQAGAGERFGIWGGLTVQERKKLRRGRREAA